MEERNYFTKEGLEKIRAELHDLKTRGRAEAAKAISEAREKGDLKENAEYDAAKESQGLLELKIKKLENTVANARLIDETLVDTSKVTILTKVRLLNKKTSKEVTYMLVSETEASLKDFKISVESPVGKGLIGKKVGEIARISVPAGIIEFEVLEISL